MVLLLVCCQWSDWLQGALCQVLLASVQNRSTYLFLKSHLRQGKSLSLSAIKALIPLGINMGNDCSQRGFATARDDSPLMFSGHWLH